MGDGSKIVAGRYRTDRELWHGRNARSLLVTDLRNGRPCVLRRLAVAEASPETARRFEAQAAILARLDHPGLPRFVDGFFDGEGAARDRVLVTSYHPGEGLDRLVEKGRALTEAQALALLRRLVPVLAYLHRFEPPLVHRFIPATGIVVGPDGRPCLTSLDYAVVESDTPAVAPAPPGPDELALAAPEIYMGVPVPASDIYALGLAIIRGMTAENPAGMLGESARLRLRESLGVSESFAGLLARMLEPSLEKRYADVSTLEADLTRLAGGKPLVAVRQPERPAEEIAAPRAWRRPLLAGVAAALVLIALGWVALTLRTAPSPEESMVLSPRPEQAAAPSPEVGTGTMPVAPPPVIPIEPSATLPPAGSEAAGPPQPSVSGAVTAPAAVPGPAPPDAPTPALVASPPAVPAAGTDSLVAQGRLLLDGSPFSDPAAPAPNFWFRNEDTKTVVKPVVEYADAGFRVHGLPPGRYGMSVRIDFEPRNPNIYPGDLNAWAEFALAPAHGEAVTIDASLRRIIRLLQPVDNNVLIPGSEVPCGGGSALPPQVVFAWESLGPGVRYLASVDRLACERGYAAVGRVFSGSIAETWAKIDLPPSSDKECYSFRLSATRDGRPAGIMAVHGKAGTGWDFRFTVAP